MTSFILFTLLSFNSFSFEHHCRLSFEFGFEDRTVLDQGVFDLSGLAQGPAVLTMEDSKSDRSVSVRSRISSFKSDSRGFQVTSTIWVDGLPSTNTTVMIV